MRGARLLRLQVPRRAAAYALLAAAALLVTLLLAHAREARELGPAARQLRLALIDAGEVVECLNGTQDDLYGPDGETSTTSAAAARTRLADCDLRPLEESLDAVRLSAPAPLTGDRYRRAHAAIEEAVGVLTRLALDVRGTRRLIERDIRTGEKSAAVLVGYTAADAAFRRANELLTAVEAALPGAT